MTATIESNIIDVHVSRIGELTVTNGYDYDVSGVIVPGQLGREWTPENRLVLVDVGSIVRLPEHDRPGNPPAIAYSLVVECKMILRSSQVSADEISAVEIMYAGRAIHKCIATPSHWWQFDDNAFHADLGEPVPFVASSGQYGGVMVPVTVWYRVSENDPFQTRS